MKVESFFVTLKQLVFLRRRIIQQSVGQHKVQTLDAAASHS